MPDAKFLEQYPLYKKYLFHTPLTLNKIPKVRINMHCQNCDTTRTFAMQNEYYTGYPYANFQSANMVVKLTYFCVSCEASIRHFTVMISPDLEHIFKIGQYPPWDISPDPNISKMLGRHKKFLSQGMICESQNYGIGAFSYYRRIVEEIIDNLLESISEILEENKKEEYKEALTKVIHTRQTSEKIELVKDLLPPILRPKGINPLSLLHGVLSEGLHAESDDRCLELAVEVREILKFLISQIEVSRNSSQAFTDSMKAILDKKAEKSNQKT